MFVDEFTADCVDDAARIKLSRKVKVVHDPAITALGAAYRHKVRVDIRFRDGSFESETREAPRGSEQSFASADDIVGKFRKLTRGVMADKQQDALVDAVLGLDRLPDSFTLIERLRATNGADVPLPLVGRGRGGGREVTRCIDDCDFPSRPPPYPPHKGEGFKYRASLSDAASLGRAAPPAAPGSISGNLRRI